MVERFGRRSWRVSLAGTSFGRLVRDRDRLWLRRRDEIRRLIDRSHLRDWCSPQCMAGTVKIVGWYSQDALPGDLAVYEGRSWACSAGFSIADNDHQDPARCRHCVRHCMDCIEGIPEVLREVLNSSHTLDLGILLMCFAEVRVADAVLAVMSVVAMLTVISRGNDLAPSVSVTSQAPAIPKVEMLEERHASGTVARLSYPMSISHHAMLAVFEYGCHGVCEIWTVTSNCAWKCSCRKGRK